MQRSRTKLVLQDGKYWLATQLDQKPNLDHVETVSGTRDQFYMDWELADTRKARPQQRRLFFALLTDIYTWSGMATDFLKDLFTWSIGSIRQVNRSACQTSQNRL
ncbi:hypothetical protein TUA1478L_33970 [Lactiplantibacillus plantarum]